MTRFILINNLDIPAVKPIQVKYCNTFLCRLRGLTFRRRINSNEGLLLVQNRDSRLDASIHMLGVGFDLTIVWINADYTVVDKVLARRWRLAYFPKEPAMYILEIHPERWNDFEVGNKVQFKNA